MRKKTVECVYCEEEIDGDILAPEGEGPMHSDCWIEWVDEENTARARGE